MTAFASTDYPFLTPDVGLAAAIAEALADCGVCVDDAGAREWKLSIGRKRGVARQIGRWLVLEFPAPRGRAPGPLRVLDRNAKLRGTAKYVLLADGSFRLRAEVPVKGAMNGGFAGFAALLSESVAGLADALGAPVSHATDEKGAGDESETDLRSLCEEARWPYSERSSGSVHVDLDTPSGAFYQAALLRDGARVIQRVRLYTDGGAADEHPAELAIAALLLSVASVVRMARAAWTESDRGTVWGFEVQLPGTTSVATFDHGLSSLAVACDLCGREVRALADDPALARSYLELRHPRLLPKKTKQKGRQLTETDLVLT
jgi:hypothetical protein